MASSPTLHPLRQGLLSTERGRRLDDLRSTPHWLDFDGNCHNLAVESALAHPEVPRLLAWSPAEVPDFGSLRGIRALAPHVHAAVHEPEALLRQIRNSLAPAPAIARQST